MRDLRSGRCHLSKETRALGRRSLRLLLHRRSLLCGRRMSSSRCWARLGGGRGLCGGHGRPAGGSSSTLTRHDGRWGGGSVVVVRDVVRDVVRRVVELVVRAVMDGKGQII